MHVKNIRLRGFRNLKDQTVDLSEGLNLLAGENGQGKTNFLEAVYVLSTLRSFRSSSIRDVINFERRESELCAEVARREIPTSLRTRLSGSTRKLWIGERPVHSAGEFLGQLRVVAFTPDDMAMVKGSPSVRRRFLDRAAFLFDPRHLVHVRNFNHALKARNQLLKERRLGDKEVIDSFSQAMVGDGARVSRTRRRILDKVGKRAEDLIAELIPESSGGRIAFKPGWEMGEEGGQGELLDQIRSKVDQDIRRGKTCLGPQQDDFGIEVESRSARKFASQGQQRAAAVALLLAVVVEVISGGGEHPVILLDDVSSELDEIRRSRLFERVDQIGGQALITTTDYGMIKDLGGIGVKMFKVSAGRIEANREE